MVLLSAHADGITEPNHAADVNFRRQSTMAAHGVQPAGTEVFFHAAAGITGARPFQYTLTNVKATPLQRE